MPASSKRARTIVEAALKRRPSERVAFIDGACGDDEALRAEVSALTDWVEAPGVTAESAGAIADAALERRLTERLAFVEGACGDDDGLKSRVLAMLAAMNAAPNPPVSILKPVLEPAMAEPAASAPVGAGEEATKLAPR